MLICQSAGIHITKANPLHTAPVLDGQVKRCVSKAVFELGAGSFTHQVLDHIQPALLTGLVEGGGAVVVPTVHIHLREEGGGREFLRQCVRCLVCGEEILTLSRISCRERKSLFSTHPQAKEGSSSPIITLTSWEIDGGWTSVMLLVKGQNNFMNHRNCYLVTHFLALVLQPLQLQHLAYPVQKPSVSGNSAQNYDGFGDNIRSVLCAVHLCKDEFMGW